MTHDKNDSIFDSVADIFVGALIFTVILQIVLGIALLAFIVARFALWIWWEAIKAFYEALIALGSSDTTPSELLQRRTQKIIGS
jgi:hypothetical protein